MQHLLLRATLINPVTSKPDDTLRHELVWGSGRLHNHYIPTTVVLPPRQHAAGGGQNVWYMYVHVCGGTMYM